VSFARGRPTIITSKNSLYAVIKPRTPHLPIETIEATLHGILEPYHGLPLANRLRAPLVLIIEFAASMMASTNPTIGNSNNSLTLASTTSTSTTSTTNSNSNSNSNSPHKNLTKATKDALALLTQLAKEHQMALTNTRRLKHDLHVLGLERRDESDVLVDVDLVVSKVAETESAIVELEVVLMRLEGQ
jgi:hypothetical protein